MLVSTAGFSQAKTGKEIYTTYCLACHQQDGHGVPKLNPPLIKTAFVAGDKPTLIEWVLKGSGEEKIPFDGEYYNNNMPPQNFLKDDEMANVLTYIRSSFGNHYSAVTPAEVKAVSGNNCKSLRNLLSKLTNVFTPACLGQWRKHVFY